MSALVNTQMIRKRNSRIADMQRVLVVFWIEDQINHHIRQSLVQSKALAPFNSVEAEKDEEAAREKLEAWRGSRLVRLKEKSDHQNMTYK